MLAGHRHFSLWSSMNIGKKNKKKIVRILCSVSLFQALIRCWICFSRKINFFAFSLPLMNCLWMHEGTGRRADCGEIIKSEKAFKAISILQTYTDGNMLDCRREKHQGNKEYLWHLLPNCREKMTLGEQQVTLQSCREIRRQMTRYWPHKLQISLGPVQAPGIP